MANLVHGCIRRRCSSHPPLQPIEQRGRRFAQGQAVAFRGGELGLGGEGVHLQALADEGAGGARATLGEAGERKAGAARWPSGVCWGRSSEFAVFAQQGDQVGESLSGGGVGVELEFELGQSAAILASSSASRAFSLLSCFIRCS